MYNLDTVKPRRTGRATNRLWRLAAFGAALLICASLAGCGAKPAAGAQVLLDGVVWDGAALPGAASGLRVYIALDGKPLIDLPFDQAREVTVRQSDGAENTLILTGESVRMAQANCENHDCVNMGEVTAENLEMRVMGGFIICLPHRLSVEVRGD